MPYGHGGRWLEGSAEPNLPPPRDGCSVWFLYPTSNLIPMSCATHVAPTPFCHLRSCPGHVSQAHEKETGQGRRVGRWVQGAEMKVLQESCHLLSGKTLTVCGNMDRDRGPTLTTSIPASVWSRKKFHGPHLDNSPFSASDKMKAGGQINHEL